MSFGVRIPNLPIDAIGAIEDENARMVLQALVDGWHVRNGAIGDGGGAFVTRAELTEATGDSEVQGFSGNWQNLIEAAGGGAQAKINAVTNRVDVVEAGMDGLTNSVANVWNDPLFKNLSESVGDLTGMLQDHFESIGNWIENVVSDQSNADQAIYSEITTRFSTFNGVIAGIKTTAETAASAVSGLAHTVDLLSVTVGDNSLSIENETLARVNADGVLLGRYSVKIDANGYISGFGLMSEANNAAPTSSFIVRADKFAIAAPTGPGITPLVPFTVTTSTDAFGNPPGVYLSTAVADTIIAKKLFAANGTLGTISAGYIYNPNNNNLVNMNATGSATFIRAGEYFTEYGRYAVEIRADGDAFFAKRIAQGTWASGPAQVFAPRYDSEGTYIGNFNGATIEIDTGYRFENGRFSQRDFSFRVGLSAGSLSAYGYYSNGQYIGNYCFSWYVELRDPYYQAPAPSSLANREVWVVVTVKLANPQLLPQAGPNYRINSLNWELFFGA